MSSWRRRKCELLQATKDRVHGVIEIFVSVTQQQGASNVLSKSPKRDMRLGVDHQQS